MCKLAGCTLNVHPANLQFRPSVSGQEQFDLLHQQQDYSLRPHNPPAGNSRCLISQAQTPNEYATYMLFGYLLLNEQPLLACLRPLVGQKVLQSSGNQQNIYFFAKAFSLIPH